MFMSDDTCSFDTLDDAACQRALAILIDVGTSIAKELKAHSKDGSPTPHPTSALKSTNPLRLSAAASIGTNRSNPS